jgi:hypothetical protein
MRANGAGVVIGGAILGALLTSASAATKLAPNDIQTTFFNGQTFTASTTSNIRYKMTFMADGRMRREPATGGTKSEGTWKLSKDGFCRTWSGGKEECFTIVNASDNKWSVLRGTTLVATWSK